MPPRKSQYNSEAKTWSPKQSSTNLVKGICMRPFPSFLGSADTFFFDVRRLHQSRTCSTLQAAEVDVLFSSAFPPLPPPMPLSPLPPLLRRIIVPQRARSRASTGAPAA